MGLFDMFKKNNSIIENNIQSFEETINLIIQNNKLWEKEEMIEYLKNINLSDEANYYFKAEFLKKDNLNLDNFRLLSFNEIVKENVSLAPGTIISRFGFIVVGVNNEGNAICIDVCNLPNDVYLAEHNILCDIYYLDKSNNKVKYDRKSVKQKLIPINKTFDKYLNSILEKYDNK